jgi:aconitate decarboxylase
VDKYRALTHSVIEPDRRQAIENAVLSLETLDDIAILTGMLNPPVNAALG